jgi:hypothetical protein
MQVEIESDFVEGLVGALGGPASSISGRCCRRACTILLTQAEGGAAQTTVTSGFFACLHR